jgi:hypothetical protein
MESSSSGIFLMKASRNEANFKITICVQWHQMNGWRTWFHWMSQRKWRVMWHSGVAHAYQNEPRHRINWWECANDSLWVSILPLPHLSWLWPKRALKEFRFIPLLLARISCWCWWTTFEVFHMGSVITQSGHREFRTDAGPHPIFEH